MGLPFDSSWTPQHGRLEFRRTFPQATPVQWPAIDAWIHDHVPPPHRAAFRVWVERRVGRPASEASQRRVGHDLIERIDEFELYRLIDGGGMGVVYEAYDTRLDRTVAVKRVRPGLRLELAARFEEEVRLTARPPHPGIPAVYRFGHDTAGQPYMAMLFADGETLADKLKGGPVVGGALEPLLDVFVRACQTVGSRHATDPQVIHRDLKPRHIVLGRNGEAVFVLDWGLSRIEWRREADPDALASGTPSYSGTPAYMAPEQFGGEVTVRTDVFQLGSILCELLTGKPAYDGPPAEQLTRAQAGDLADARARLACVERSDLVDLALRCLDPDPSHRPATATAVGDEILALRGRAEDRRRQAERARVRDRWLAVSGVLAAALLATAGVGLMYWRWSTDHTAAAESQAQAARQAEAAAERWRQYHLADRHKMYAFRILATDFRGTRAEAELHFRQAVDLLVPLAAERPDEPAYAHALAECRFYQGWLAFTDLKGGRSNEAISLLRQAEDGFAAAQAAGWAAEAGFPNGTPAALERDDCRCLRGVILLAASSTAAPGDGLATEAFELFDDLWVALPPGARPAGPRPGQLELLARLARLTADHRVRFQSSYSPQAIASLRAVAQMAAEMEQSRIPWSTGPRTDHPRAVRAAARLAGSQGVSDGAVYNAACVYALAAADAAAAGSVRAERADAALAYLERLRGSGYFSADSKLRELEADADLAPLRSVPRFKTLLARIRAGRGMGGLTGGLGDFGLRSAD